MSDIALRTVGLGKMYHIGAERERYRTLRDTLTQAGKRPLERIRHPGAATHVSEELWALQGIDVEVKQGEVLGVIGRNGSGKSTLLKVLSHITEPTEGRAEVRGRVASLLEVGTGFHPELTGRENIQFNGAILGMTRAEMKSRFNKIVEFSEIGRFLDTPVKRYSSGMYVRLAFAVAAHLEPEILIVDEVLAVGDAEFQRKCLGKMGEVAHGGRTVVFVSHNLAAVMALCSRAVLLDAGRLVADGVTKEIVSRYTSSSKKATSSREWSRETAPGDEFARLLKIQVRQDGEDVRGIARSSLSTEVALTVLIERPRPTLQVGFELLDERGVEVFETCHSDSDERQVLPAGVHQLCCNIPAGLLNGGRYVISPIAALHRDRWILHEAHYAALGLEVTIDHSHSDLWQGARSGLLAPCLAWWTVSAVAEPRIAGS